MRNIILIFILASSTFAFSQKDSVLVRFALTEKTTGESIQNVNGVFSFAGQNKIVVSNSKGFISFYAPINTLITYQFAHPLFESTNGVKKIGNPNPTDTIIVGIELTMYKGKQLNEVVVKAPGVPDTVFESKRLSVADFEIQSDGRLILLTYAKQLKKGSELLLYDGLSVQNSFNVPGIAKELVRDYRGNTHVVCEENVFGLHLGDGTIGISTLDKGYFTKYIAPIVDTTDSKMFFSNFSKDYPAFNYFSFDQLDSTYAKIIHIEDELMMELYRSEYKWVDVRTKLWAKNKEIETGVDAEIWVGANYFTSSIYYKELYAPMFSKNDTVYVFDYYKDKLFSFNEFGEPIDSVAIYHHYQPKSTGWKKQLVQDHSTGEVYAVFDKGGFSYIGLIDLKTGEIKEKVRLEFRYIDKIAINDNFVYYIYRPFESTQKKFLYKERLPYEFGKAKVPYGKETTMETGK